MGTAAADRAKNPNSPSSLLLLLAPLAPQFHGGKRIASLFPRPKNSDRKMQLSDPVFGISNSLIPLGMKVMYARLFMLTFYRHCLYFNYDRF
jgi:hypothetical protein